MTMSKKVPYTEVLKRLKYKPKWVTDPDFDHVVVISFRDIGRVSASIEFGQELRCKDQNGKKAQDFYFERVDWNGYIDGDFLPLDSDRRKDVMHMALTWDNIDQIMAAVNTFLKKHYSRRVK